MAELPLRSKVGSRVPRRRRRPIWVTAAVAGLIVIGVVVAVFVFAPLKVTAVYAYPQPARIPACAPSVNVLGTIFINNHGGTSATSGYARMARSRRPPRSFSLKARRLSTCR